MQINGILTDPQNLRNFCHGFLNLKNPLLFQTLNNLFILIHRSNSHILHYFIPYLFCHTLHKFRTTQGKFLLPVLPVALKMLLIINEIIDIL